MSCDNLISCYKFFSGSRAISSVGRASRLHREGREFESLIAHQQFGGVAQLVRALACHARGREFESRHSRQKNYFFLFFSSAMVRDLAVFKILFFIAALVSSDPVESLQLV